ncbi:uncharacterized protein LOC127867723 [Dreissena polymorpha]|uniref:uncharacterized protein LOC127867723 n=1 Tax=Dreissena polymorpha TaxID=45954 RepID=UPI002263D4E0|nr:uncharacterized protein LOC127867723 [Dreissena polymorpha]
MLRQPVKELFINQREGEAEAHYTMEPFDKYTDTHFYGSVEQSNETVQNATEIAVDDSITCTSIHFEDSRMFRPTLLALKKESNHEVNLHSEQHNDLTSEKTKNSTQEHVLVKLIEEDKLDVYVHTNVANSAEIDPCCSSKQMDERLLNEHTEGVDKNMLEASAIYGNDKSAIAKMGEATIFPIAILESRQAEKRTTSSERSLILPISYISDEEENSGKKSKRVCQEHHCKNYHTKCSLICDSFKTGESERIVTKVEEKKLSWPNDMLAGEVQAMAETQYQKERTMEDIERGISGNVVEHNLDDNDERQKQSVQNMPMDTSEFNNCRRSVCDEIEEEFSGAECDMYVDLDVLKNCGSGTMCSDDDLGQTFANFYDGITAAEPSDEAVLTLTDSSSFQHTEHAKIKCEISDTEPKSGSGNILLTDSGFIEIYSSSPSNDSLEISSNACQNQTSVGEIVNPDCTNSDYGIEESCSSYKNDSKSVGLAHIGRLSCNDPTSSAHYCKNDESTECEGNINAHIIGLHYPLLIQILSHLSVYTLLRVVPRVCRFWNQASRDRDLWVNINIRNQLRLDDGDLIQLLSRTAGHTRHLNVSDCRLLSDVAVQHVLSTNPALVTLKLIRCYNLTDEAFNVTQNTHHTGLKNVYLDGCSRLTDTAVERVSNLFPNLECLHLNQCTKVTDEAIKLLANNCPRLTVLQLDHCLLVTDAGLAHIAKQCHNMQNMNLMSCGITDDCGIHIAKIMTLTHLDLSNLPRISPGTVVFIARHCSLIQCLNVSLNMAIGDQCVEQVVIALPRLKRLYCVCCSISDAGLEAIAKHCTCLESLDIGWCQSVTDPGIRVVSLACKILEYFGLIRCDQITSETIDELVVEHPHINYSTFLLDSKRLFEKARREGYKFDK